MSLEGVPAETAPLIYRSVDMSERSVPTTCQSEATAQLPRKKAPVYAVLPLLCVTRFATAITTTAKIDFIRQGACIWWFTEYIPVVPSSGGIYLPEGCDTPSVDKAFSDTILILTVIDALGGIISSMVINWFTKRRYGRKPVMLVLATLNAISTACFIAAMWVNGSLQTFLLLACVVLGALCGPGAFSLVCQMYIGDTTQQHKLTFVFNLVDGLAALTTAPTFWLGGYLSKEFTIVTVFWIKFLVIIPLILHVLMFVPESLSSELRSTVNMDRGSPTLLLETHRWLFFMVLSQFIRTLGSEYVGNAFVTYTAVKFRIGADGLVIAFTAFTVSQAVWLSAIVGPATLSWGRPHSHDGLEAQTGDSTHVAKCVNFAAASSLSGALASMTLGLAPSLNVIIAAYTMLSLGTGYDPTISSVVATSVDPVYRDQALSALTIARSVGSLLAPLIFGPILSSTIPSYPQLVFFLFSATIAFAAMLLPLAKALGEQD